VTQGIVADAASAVADWGERNFGNPQTLIDFVTWGRKKFPSKRTMLIIWNHGQGWRRPKQGETVPVHPPSAVRYVSNDDLRNGRIGEALRDVRAIAFPPSPRIDGADVAARRLLSRL